MSKAATITNERKLSDFPEYALAAGKLAGLKTELDTTEARFQTVNGLILEATSPGAGSGTGKPAYHPGTVSKVGILEFYHPDVDEPTSAQQEQMRDQFRERQATEQGRVRKSPAQIRLEQAADRMLSDEPGDVVTDTGTEPLRKELGDLQYKMSVLRVAITKQERIVNDLARKYSRMICESLKPEYLKLVQATAAALHHLAEADDEMRRFWDTANQSLEGVSSTLTPLAHIGLGVLDNPNSRASAVLRDAENIVKGTA